MKGRKKRKKRGAEREREGNKSGQELLLELEREERGINRNGWDAKRTKKK